MLEPLAVVPAEEHEALRRPRLRRLKLMGGIALAAALAVVGVGAIARVQAADQVKTWTAAQAVPTVSVIQPSGQAGAQSLILPATAAGRAVTMMNGSSHDWKFTTIRR